MDMYTGVPGSGKTYKVVKKIIDEHKTYSIVYTNIDNFQYDKIPNSKKLNWSYFYSVLKEVYEMKHNLDAEDAEIQEFLFSKGVIYKDAVGTYQTALFAIDEAQNYFNKADDVLLLFITQHRHFFIDLILITQNYTLIHHSYRLMNVLVDAERPSKKIMNRLTYKTYAGVPNSYNKIDTIVEKIDKKVFEYYHSGDKVKTKSAFKKPLIILLSLVILFYFLFSFFISSFKPSSNNNVESLSGQVVNSSNKIKDDKALVVNKSHLSSLDSKNIFLISILFNRVNIKNIKTKKVSYDNDVRIFNFFMKKNSKKYSYVDDNFRGTYQNSYYILADSKFFDSIFNFEKEYEYFYDKKSEDEGSENKEEDLRLTTVL